MRIFKIFLSYFLITVVLTSIGYSKDLVQIAVVNPMEKVFQDDTLLKVSAPKVLHLECAANEYEPAQFAIRSNRKLKNVSIELTDLVDKENRHKISSKNVHWNFIGFIPIVRNTPDVMDCGQHKYVPKGEILRKAPCNVPDPLLDVKNLTIDANRTQPVWLTVHVLEETPSGVYHGKVIVITPVGRKIIPVELTVYPFELPKARHLYITNWFNIDKIAKVHNVKKFSRKFWKILERYAQNMYQHRQNVFIVPWQLIKVYREKNDKLSFDYSIFDRYIKTFIHAGVSDMIEISFVAHFGKGGWYSKKVVLNKVNIIDKKTGNVVYLTNNQGISALLRSLQKHLEKKGWLKRSVIHVADEPSYHNIASWKKAARFVRKYAPKIRTIDAIEATGFGSLLDIYVAHLGYIRNWDSYRRAQRSGAELWFYTSCQPYGYYPNKFLDYSLIKIRILPWMDYAFHIQGYLNWGLNAWNNNPFGLPNPKYPPGDTHLIYPGDNGPLNSIRWEMLREGIEDYEYFWLLESKTRKVQQQLGVAAKDIPLDFRAKEICGKLVKSFIDYTREPKILYSTRKLLASEIANIDKPPLILITTNPPSNTELMTGPAEVIVHGVVEKGTKVKVNGKDAEVNSDGSFTQDVSLSHSNHILKVEAELNGKMKVLEREFKVK